MDRLALDEELQSVHISSRSKQWEFYMAACSVRGCENGAVARGLCDKHRKRVARHGHSGSTRPIDWGKRTSHPLYKQWHGIIRRCHDTKHRDFCNYGARGVAVCDRWHDFWAFIADVGPRPSNRHSIGRIDNDGDYSPENAEWQTPEEQGRNRRSSVLTKEHVVEIRRRSKLGEKTGDIARSMGLAYDNVRNVLVGACFKDIA